MCFQALPEDLKTKLSLDEDLVSSPKEALSRASADRIAMRHKHLKRFGLLIYSFFFSFFCFFPLFELDLLNTLYQRQKSQTLARFILFGCTIRDLDMLNSL